MFLDQGLTNSSKQFKERFWLASRCSRTKVALDADEKRIVFGQQNHAATTHVTYQYVYRQNFILLFRSNSVRRVFAFVVGEAFSQLLNSKPFSTIALFSETKSISQKLSRRTATWIFLAEICSDLVQRSCFRVCRRTNILCLHTRKSNRRWLQLQAQSKTPKIYQGERSIFLVYSSRFLCCHRAGLSRGCETTPQIQRSKTVYQ